MNGILISFLVLNAGNGWEWSIITSNNHPSNPQQPILSLLSTLLSTSKFFWMWFLVVCYVNVNQNCWYNRFWWCKCKPVVMTVMFWYNSFELLWEQLSFDMRIKRIQPTSQITKSRPPKCRHKSWKSTCKWWKRCLNSKPIAWCLGLELRVNFRLKIWRSTNWESHSNHEIGITWSSGKKTSCGLIINIV